MPLPHIKAFCQLPTILKIKSRVRHELVGSLKTPAPSLTLPHLLNHGPGLLTGPAWYAPWLEVLVHSTVSLAGSSPT